MQTAQRNIAGELQNQFWSPNSYILSRSASQCQRLKVSFDWSLLFSNTGLWRRPGSRDIGRWLSRPDFACNLHPLVSCIAAHPILGLLWLVVDSPLPAFSLLVLMSSVARGSRNSPLFSDGILLDDFVYSQKPMQSLASVSPDLPICAPSLSFLGTFKRRGREIL